MPAKKKSKPSYSVPEDLQAAPQSGWVYRSVAGEAAQVETPPAVAAAAQPEAPPPVEEACVAQATGVPPPAGKQTTARSSEPRKSTSVTTEILDLTSKTLTSGLATIGNAVLLGTRIATAPFLVGMRWIGLWSR
jgi:hypothetical protein